MIGLSGLVWFCGQAVLIAMASLFFWEWLIDRIKDSVTGL